MKRFISVFLVLCMLLMTSSAFAVKARNISSDEDAAYHIAHITKHIGSVDLHGTGNYLKVRNKAKMNAKVLGHLEQADKFLLIDVQNGLAYIEVLYSDSTSPDSWIGLKGWVDCRYLDCQCSYEEYENPNYAYAPNVDAGTLPTGGETGKTSDWQTAYYQYISTHVEGYQEYTYTFFDLNGDAIPELAMNGRCEADGMIFLTYSNGRLDYNVTSGLDSGCSIYTYMEGKNLLLDKWGKQGCYRNELYYIENGQWVEYAYSQIDIEISDEMFDDEIAYAALLDERDRGLQSYYLTNESLFNPELIVGTYVNGLSALGYDESKASEFSNFLTWEQFKPYLFN